MAKKTNKRGAGRPFSNIDVPKETKKFWKDNYQVGDFTEISIKKEIARPTLRKAWRGNASASNIEKITDFYKERIKNTAVLEEKIKLTSLGKIKKVATKLPQKV